MAGTERFDPETFLKSLTTKPGVYCMLDADGQALYVGKARNLKARVTSYFRASGLSAKTMALVSRIDDIQVTVTQSETEALLLEQSLVKAERPPYNVVLRDDKSYPYICLTGHAEFPRLKFHRGAKRRDARYFGPFPSAYAVRDSLNILQKLFQLRSCDDGFFRNRSRPCLQYQIKRCSGPCVGLIDPAQYAEDVRLAVLFLEGSSQSVLNELKRKMDAAAAGLEFERAARYRDQVAHLRRVQEAQYVHGAAGDADTFAIAVEGGFACVQGLFVRDGRVLGQRTWFPKNELDVGPGELLSAFLSQYYFGGVEREVPKSVIASEPPEDRDVLRDALAARAGRRVELSVRVRGQRARWVEMARENASLSLGAYLADRRNVFARFVDLQEALGMEDLPQRLECFDISHTGGNETVASCVVFDTSGPLKSDYRRFNIEGVVSGDDFAAMEQALRRRYRRGSGRGSAKESAAGRHDEAVFPDVLIIDGGIGQLNRAARVLEELQIDGVRLLAIAKGRSRKPGLERVFAVGEGVLTLPPSGGAFHLLRHIRDEAHRFAITGHRGRRQKRQRRSELDGIPGVGAKRKRELLAHFGSVASVKGASEEEIAKVPGISRRLAQNVYAALHAG
ncbi:MAG: excinuclease ABC subunit UvrC [Gammaproteobacteria bacterium]|nr:excinuclease ABC subunit UvrC [Gammaproteobacteria bacterium]